MENQTHDFVLQQGTQFTDGTDTSVAYRFVINSYLGLRAASDRGLHKAGLPEMHVVGSRPSYTRYIPAQTVEHASSIAAMLMNFTVNNAHPSIYFGNLNHTINIESNWPQKIVAVTIYESEPLQV